MNYENKNFIMGCLVLIFLLLLCLLGIYLETCTYNEYPKLEKCNDIMIIIKFFCILFLSLFLLIIMSECCNKNEHGTICIISSVIDLKNETKSCCSHNLNVIFKEFCYCCCCKKKDDESLLFGIPINV